MQNLIQKKGQIRTFRRNSTINAKNITHRVEIDFICELIFLSKIDNVVKNSTKCQKKIHLKEKWILTVISAQIRTKV